LQIYAEKQRVINSQFVFLMGENDRSINVLRNLQTKLGKNRQFYFLLIVYKE
jgi:hypothetical protein